MKTATLSNGKRINVSLAGYGWCQPKHQQNAMGDLNAAEIAEAWALSDQMMRAGC